LIRINDRLLSAWINASSSGREDAMPFDAMVVSAAVTIMFLMFAGVLLWGDYQTRPERQKAAAPLNSAKAPEAIRRAA
jgi:hypothetical protein